MRTRSLRRADGTERRTTGLWKKMASGSARGWRLISCCLAVLLFVQLPAAAQGQAPAATSKVFRAGASTSNITPWLGEKIVGRGSNTPPAATIHDQMHARTLVLDDGETKLVFVTVDNLGIRRQLLDEVKRRIHAKTGIPKEQVLISATHTHSGTNARGKGPIKGSYEEPLSEYQTFLIGRIVDGVSIALNNLAPARIGWGAGDVPQHVHNRRWILKPGTPMPNPFGGQDKAKMNPGIGNPALVKPAGPVDPQVSFLSVQSPDGRPIALLANYSLHYVGGIPSDHVSADYFAAFADRIQELLKADRQDPPFVAIMSNGTSGDVISTDHRGPAKKEAPYVKLRRVADDLAQEVLRVHKTIRFHDWVKLRSAYAELPLRVRKPSPEILAYARKALARPSTEKPENPRERDYAHRALNLHENWPDMVEAPVQVFGIGDLGIAASPFETFAETGLEIKAKSPFKSTFTIELANGSSGYLPTPEQHKLGGYETWLGTNSVQLDASTKLTSKILELFETLK